MKEKLDRIFFLNFDTSTVQTKLKYNINKSKYVSKFISKFSYCKSCLYIYPVNSEFILFFQNAGFHCTYIPRECIKAYKTKHPPPKKNKQRYFKVHFIECFAWFTHFFRYVEFYCFLRNMAFHFETFFLNCKHLFSWSTVFRLKNCSLKFSNIRPLGMREIRIRSSVGTVLDR